MIWGKFGYLLGKYRQITTKNSKNSQKFIFWPMDDKKVTCPSDKWTGEVTCPNTMSTWANFQCQIKAKKVVFSEAELHLFIFFQWNVWNQLKYEKILSK